jgi:hypothetical protein
MLEAREGFPSVRARGPVLERCPDGGHDVPEVDHEHGDGGADDEDPQRPADDGREGVGDQRCSAG